MSGNPFRRAAKGSARIPDEQPNTYPFRSNDNDNVPNTVPTERRKKRKTVTIQTPPQSPESSPQRRRSSGHISPPPPVRSRQDDVEDSDSTTTADSDLEAAVRNTRRNSGSLVAPALLGGGFGGGSGEGSGGRSGGGGAPYNPFARTLATSEAAFGLQRSTDEGVQQDGGEGRIGTRGVGRPAMDVDQFKNILMNGSALPSISTPTNAPAPTARFQDSSSNTDASSASQQSLFDPYLEIHSETPRTSFDQMDSPSDSEDGGEDDNSGLMSGTTRSDDFAPPAPPKHSHGRPLTAVMAAPKGPQTVSFDEFDDSISAGPKRQQSLNVPTLHRSPSDLNKPLPPPPMLDPGSPRTAEPLQLETGGLAAQESRDALFTAGVEDNAETKKAPPPPPPTSRRGQSTSSQGRARSTSDATEDFSRDDMNATQQEPISMADEPVSKTTAPAAAPPPPPPPSRKSKPPTQPQIAVVEAPSDTQLSAPSTAESAKPMPPPPPRRMASKAGNSVNRSTSTASHSSVQRKENTSSNATPPAPPPRRGKRESMDIDRRSSGQSGVMSPNKETERDVLADMSAFQAEIEALRKRAGPG
ncbi:hypothetical protein LTR09_004009 [Extremus antarcticus]|uniref:Uncharacterized protein n=1 Tax=Extremus antarcticus TaxID=702011 RepID=A0AAJ0DIZ1_9PEZI|nr:hypothetical protein LTR09_004009 [Extremus antarcticus]